MKPSSKLNDADSQQEAPDWLKEVYKNKQQRTVELVKASIDVLRRENQLISLTTIEAKSKELDPEGRGVSVSAINRNKAANDYYRQHRSYKEPSKRKTASVDTLRQVDALRVKADRDLARVQQRYLKLTKEALVERLIAVENALAEQQNCWHQNNDQLLSQLLKAEAEEKDDDFQIEESDEKTQALVAKIERLRSEKRELKARLQGMESLEAEVGQLKKQNTHLMNLLRQATLDERERDAKRFAEALRESQQPELPEVEF